MGQKPLTGANQNWTKCLKFIKFENYDLYKR